MKCRKILAILSLVAMLLLGSAVGQASAGPLITVDENGNGFATGFGPLPFNIGPDPGPGGLPAVLIYTLPFAGTQGDVLMQSVGTEPGIAGTVIFDVVRFNGDGTLIFYSDNVPASDSLGDTPSPPGSLYANQVTVTESGPDDFNNAAFYVPTAGQPGFDPSGPQYNLISDTPEPATLTLMGIGGAGLAAGAWWRKRRRLLEALA